jgi:hypothetical protein
MCRRWRGERLFGLDSYEDVISFFRAEAFVGAVVVVGDFEESGFAYEGERAAVGDIGEAGGNAFNGKARDFDLSDFESFEYGFTDIGHQIPEVINVYDLPSRHQS